MQTSTYRVVLNGESRTHENYESMYLHWKNIVDHIEARGGNAQLFESYAGPETKMSSFVNNSFCVDGICFHPEKLIAEIIG